MARLLPVALVLAIAAFGCAKGGTESGTPRDNCKIRDCGPSSGGDADPLPEEDTEPEEDFGPPPDTRTDSVATDTAADAGCKLDGSVCTTFPQCGCGPGLNCDYTSEKTACVAAGSKTLYQRCAGPGECAKGFTCEGRLCVPFCGKASDCTGMTAADCRLLTMSAGDGGVKEIPGSGVCTAQCDLINPTKVCGAGLSCDFWDYDKGQTYCNAAGTGTTVNSCKSDVYACAPGYTCIVPGDCRRWCRVGFPGDCPSGKPCQQFSNHPKVDGIEYGVCAY